MRGLTGTAEGGGNSRAEAERQVAAGCAEPVGFTAPEALQFADNRIYDRGKFGVIHNLPLEEEGRVAGFFGQDAVFHQSQILHPFFEFGRGAQLEELAQRGRIVDRRCIDTRASSRRPSARP